MRLLLVRHGETERNAGGVTLGREDVPLNARGRAQAAALARALPSSRYGLIDVVYASPLRRALETAGPIADALGLEPRVDERLIEMDVGEVEGLRYPELRERHPDFLRAWLSDEVADVVMPGGESLVGVQERASAAVESARELHEDGTVAFVSHNFVILTTLCRALDLPLSRFRRLRHELAAVSVIDLTPGGTTVLALNDTSHLNGAGLASQARVRRL